MKPTYPTMTLSTCEVDGKRSMSLTPCETDDLVEAMASVATLTKIAQDAARALSDRICDVETARRMEAERESEAYDKDLMPNQQWQIYACAILEALEEASKSRAPRELPRWARAGGKGAPTVPGVVVSAAFELCDVPMIIHDMRPIAMCVVIKLGSTDLNRSHVYPTLTLEASPDGVRRARELAALYTT